MSNPGAPLNQIPAPSDDALAARLRGFGPAGIAAIAIITASLFVGAPLTALLVLGWAQLSKTPWREIGYVRPKSWIGAILIGIVFGVAFKFLMKAVVLPLLVSDPINHTYHNLVGNPQAFVLFSIYLVIGGGWAEETFFRGYLFERLGKLLGSSLFAKALTVFLPAMFFASLHYPQGLGGVEQAVVTGLVFGTIFMLTGRLFMLMVAHAAFDVTSAVIIYLNAESHIAHLVFK